MENSKDFNVCDLQFLGWPQKNEIELELIKIFRESQKSMLVSIDKLYLENFKSSKQEKDWHELKLKLFKEQQSLLGNFDEKISDECKRMCLGRMQKLSEYLFDDRLELNIESNNLKIRAFGDQKKDFAQRNSLIGKIRANGDKANFLTKKNIRRIHKVTEKLELPNPTEMMIRNLNDEKKLISDFKIQVSLEFPKIPTLDFFGLVRT